MSQPLAIDEAAWQTLSRITELRNATLHFLDGFHWAGNDEIGTARAALGLANVLRKLDNKTIEGFPRNARHAARYLREEFFNVMARWDWTEATGPEAETIIEWRKERYDHEVYRPFLTTVLSCDEGYRERGEEVPPRVAEVAKIADELGLSPTVPFEEAVATLQERYKQYYSTPIIGVRWGMWLLDESERFCRAKLEIIEATRDLRRRLGLPEEGPVLDDHVKILKIARSGNGNTERDADAAEKTAAGVDPAPLALPNSTPDAARASNGGPDRETNAFEAAAPLIEARGPETQEAKRPSVPPTTPDDESSATEGRLTTSIKLNRTHRALLQASYLLRAFDESSARSQKQIVSRFDPDKDPNSGNFNRAFTVLVREGLMASKEGPDGGRWLTEKGLAAASP